MPHAPRFPPPHSNALLSPEPKALCSAFLFGVSHSLVVHKLWVLVVVGSNPATPTNNFNRLRVSPTSPETRPPTYSSTSHRVSGQGSGRQGVREAALFDAHVEVVLRHAFIGPMMLWTRTPFESFRGMFFRATVRAGPLPSPSGRATERFPTDGGRYAVELRRVAPGDGVGGDAAV